MLSTDPPHTTRSQWDLRFAGNFVLQMGSRVASIGSRESNTDLMNIGRSLESLGSYIALSHQWNSTDSTFSDDLFQ